MTDFYNTQMWKATRSRALARDGRRCTVSRLLGGACKGALHAHHVIPLSEGGAKFDLDNIGTACAAHHPMWESLRRVLVRKMLQPAPRCRHQHRSSEARAICERRLARASGRIAA